jgi:hypothetical protein
MEDTTTITATREQLVDAFEKWMHDFNADGKGFQSMSHARKDPRAYGESCADHLIKYLNEKPEEENKAEEAGEEVAPATGENQGQKAESSNL